MQMTALLLYIIHEGFPSGKQRESVRAAEISGRNRHERKNVTFCMLTRLIRVSFRAAERWGLALHACQSRGPVRQAPGLLFPHPLFPRSLFIPGFFDDLYLLTAFSGYL